MPRVSVIIPTYNAATTLEKAVISVLNQTEQDFEIIIIDDCSTDSTPQIIQRITSYTPQIQYYRLSTNQGRSAALNFGFTKCSGIWISVLDADDWYADTRLYALLEKAESSDVQMIADNQFFVEGKSIVSTAFKPSGRDKKIQLDSYLENSNALLPFDYGMLKPIILRSFWEEHRLHYYVPARNGQDFYFLLSFFSAGGMGMITDAPYYYYLRPFKPLSPPKITSKKYYNFKLMQEVNAHFIKLYQKSLSNKNLNILLQRQQDFATLIAFHEIKESLSNRHYIKTIALLLSSPIELWRLLASRVIQCIRRKIIPPF